MMAGQPTFYRKRIVPLLPALGLVVAALVLAGCNRTRVSNEAVAPAQAERPVRKQIEEALRSAEARPPKKVVREVAAPSVEVARDSIDTAEIASVSPPAGGPIATASLDLRSDTVIVDEAADAGLPKVFPWPPPRPSARLIINQQLVNSAIAPDFTLGRVADKLLESLTAAGYEGSGFLAAPNGFVIVTRVEQIDAQGSPVADRWIGEIAASGPFSLGNIIRLLLQAPAGYFRVIVFVVSDHPVAGGENRSDTLEILREWSQSSHLRLPPPLRLLPYNDSYSVVALIYEFEKHENGDDPGARVPGRLSAARHLENLKMRANDTQYSLTDRVD